MHTLTFLLGASGTGKTTVARLLAQTAPHLRVLYFDDIGVPPVEEMVRDYGSGEGWQRAMTDAWVARIAREDLREGNILLELQSRPSFIEEACAASAVTNYRCILLDCTDEVRRERLASRGQPELANEQMLQWARILREESITRGYSIIDTSEQTPEESATALLLHINPVREG